MIHPDLYKKAVVLDTQEHRDFKIAKPANPWEPTKAVNSILIAAVEFGDVCSDYPILFIDAGKDEEGKSHMAPIAALGVANGENLFVEGESWRARYIPALIRAYPFGVARAPGDRLLIMIDEAWDGWSRTEGHGLFDEKAQASKELEDVKAQLQKIEAEMQRTRLLGDALMEADLLSPMRFDATLSDGQKITVDGFWVVDEKKLSELPDEKVVEFHRKGVLSLINAHQISMRHMQKLAEWRVARTAAA